MLSWMRTRTVSSPIPSSMSEPLRADAGSWLLSPDRWRRPVVYVVLNCVGAAATRGRVLTGGSRSAVSVGRCSGQMLIAELRLEHGFRYSCWKLVNSFNLALLMSLTKECLQVAPP